MKAAILTPAYTHLHPALQRVLLQTGLPFLPLYQHSDLPRVRSVLIEQGLARGAERLILIDADTIPTVDGLLALAESPLVTPMQGLWGVYVLRDGDRWSVHPEDQDEAAGAFREGRRFRIKTGGLGYCAIHRESLERAGARLPTITEDTGTRWRPFCVPVVHVVDDVATYYADDGSLCVRLRESGTELWCDPTLRAGHAATTILTEPHPQG